MTPGNAEAPHKHAHAGLVEPPPQKTAAKLAALAVGRIAGKRRARKSSFAPGKPCDGSIRAGNDSGPRDLSAIHLVIIHCTESPNPAAHGVAEFFRSGSRSNGIGSTQLIVDDASCYRTLPDNVIPWGAPYANTAGVHIEQCGYTAWTRSQWLAHLPTIKRCAWKAARACHKYGIPAVWLSPTELRAGKKGVSSHANVSLAWPVPDAHTDPGHGYPLDKFRFWLKHYYEAMS